ncbi:MAG: hypothetical protein II215_01215 [Paludibacteraceae bacterium]|nr:hypothetical protein [Paludibacteraceae bacterium]
MKKINKSWIGLLLCLLLPLLVFVCTWTPVSNAPLAEVHLWLRAPVFMQYLLFCMLPDLVLLFLGYKSDCFTFCRGGVLGLAPYLCTLFYLFT